MAGVTLSLLEGVTVEREGEQVTISRGSEGVWSTKLAFKQLSPGMRVALELVAGPGASSAELVGRVMATDGFAGLGQVKMLQKRLEEQGFVKYRVSAGDRALLTLRPAGAYFRHQGAIDKDARLVMSRFAYLRRGEDGDMLVTSPTAHAVATLHDPSMTALLARAGTVVSVGELAGALGPGVDEETLLAALSCLASAGAVVKVEGDAPREDVDPALAQWPFADLLFHSQSRLGRHSNPFGATFRHAARFTSPPAVKASMATDVIPLYKPDLERLKREERSFTAVQEERRSVREYGAQPIHVEQLGELLYRSARIKKLHAEAGVSWRPSAAGGAIHELELYPIVASCEGLASGLYHYDPKDHALEPLGSAAPQDLQRLVHLAALTGMLEQPPQVVLVVAARFQRIHNKYESVGYSVILKNVGCLFQSIYLVAEAMGLAACAIGGGDSDQFSRLAGLDYYAETSVGELLIGSGPAVRPEPLTPPKGVVDGRPRWT